MTRVVVPDAEIAERLSEIERAAFAPANPEWSAEDFAALNAPDRVAIVTDNTIEHGLILLQFAADEAEVLNVAVVPDARRNGLGRTLLTHGIELCRSKGIERVFLEVSKDNAPARCLYESQGFEEVGIRKNYYLRRDGSRMDALVMSLRLLPV